MLGDVLTLGSEDGAVEYEGYREPIGATLTVGSDDVEGGLEGDALGELVGASVTSFPPRVL